jgi:8-oxo-dGTP pyrophosphatase MutT (NUDIX family)
MLREISAGGVVIRAGKGGWRMAAIELPLAPTTGTPRSTKPVAHRPKRVIALPKGLVDPGEPPLETAVREVREETGTTAVAITKLADIKYVYVRSWGDGERVFKIVSFYLLRYHSGRINDIAPEMRIEVKRAFWTPLQEAPALLSYKGERDMARLALEYLKSHPDT